MNGGLQAVPIKNCSARWQDDQLPKAIINLCATRLLEVKLIRMTNGSLLTSLKEKKIMTVWDPAPMRSPYGNPFFHDEKKVKRSAEKRSTEKESFDENTAKNTSLENRPIDNGSVNVSNIIRALYEWYTDKTSHDGRPVDESSLDNKSPEKSSSDKTSLEKSPSDKMSLDKSSKAKRSKRAAEPFFHLCQEFQGSVYVLIDNDDDLVYQVKTVKCNTDGCHIASKRFKIGECIARKKTVQLHISDGCKGLKPLTIEVGCNCECMKSLLFL